MTKLLPNFLLTIFALLILTTKAENESLDAKVSDIQKRLYSIEDKIDHLLFHHSHDVTPHNIQFTPMGPVMMPQITNPNSAHTQMKTHDILRNGVVNPYMGGYGQFSPYQPLF